MIKLGNSCCQRKVVNSLELCMCLPLVFRRTLREVYPTSLSTTCRLLHEKQRQFWSLLRMYQKNHWASIEANCGCTSSLCQFVQEHFCCSQLSSGSTDACSQSRALQRLILKGLLDHLSSLLIYFWQSHPWCLRDSSGADHCILGEEISRSEETLICIFPCHRWYSWGCFKMKLTFLLVWEQL